MDVSSASPVEVREPESAPEPAPAVDLRQTPAHAVHLPGGEWRMWKNVVLRGTGFPASLVQRFAGATESAAADRYEAADDEVRRLQEGEEQSRAALKRAIALRDAAYRDLVRACDADAAVVEERTAELLSDERFREALVWQNMQSLPTLMRRLNDRVGSPSERRKAAKHIAMRAQRYAVKNDCIGFFGPVGWARVLDVPTAIDVAAGPNLVTRRTVYFEGWCIDALAERLNQDPRMNAWASPRLRSGIWRNGGDVYVPIEGKVPITAREEAVLALCDGVRTAVHIAAALVGAEQPLFASREDVFDTLEALVGRKLVVWRLEAAPQLSPERELAERLDRIGDPALHTSCRGALDALCAARHRVANAAGHPEELARRLGELEETFTRLTGAAPTRRPGEMYAARGLVYEDCLRGWDVTFGRPFLDRIGPPLSIALDAARWLSAELTAGTRRGLRRLFSELRAQCRDPIDAHMLVSYVEDVGRAPYEAMSREVTDRYQAAWHSILDIQSDERHRTYALADVGDRAREAFATDETVWGRANYLSPDLMVAAADVAAFRRGEFQCILGELHGMNTLLSNAVVSQHPSPWELTSSLAHDTRDDTIVLRQLPREDWLVRTDRLSGPTYYRYEEGEDLPRPGCRPLPAAKLVPFDNGRTIVMRARDGSLEFDIIELFAPRLGQRWCNLAAERLPRAPHMPRITIGDLTISREMWYVTPVDMTFLEIKDPYAQFAAVRQWTRERGIPRRVFYKPPQERKPCYVDFRSRVYVAIFVSFLKQVPARGEVRIVEMLPGFQDLWLADAGGQRYTCEVRMAARHE